MSINITAQTESVETVLKTAKKSHFLIPEYQRQYTWKIENIDKLFDDLWNFSKTDKTEYFLGTIVTYTHKENNVETQQIVDGQQRLTSLFLLLRAIYNKLEEIEEDEEEGRIKRLKEKVSSLIWEVDPDTLKITNKDVSYLTSKVLDDEDGNKILSQILKDGIANGNDFYSQNYRHFIELIKSVEDQIDIFPRFVRRLLENVILLPLRTENEDDALCIFHNINTGGLKLSDSDIFKAKIYKHLKQIDEIENSNKLSDFIKQWKSMIKDITYCSGKDKFDEVDNLFYYYMFYLRAIEGDVETTTPERMEYFKTKINNIEFQRLYEPTLMSNIQLILKFKKYWFTGEINKKWPWSENPEIKKYLDILNDFPNEFGKYPVVIFFLKNHINNNFETEFLVFLRNFINKLIPKYLINPTVNGIKPDILKLNKSIVIDKNIVFGFENSDIDLVNLPIKIARPATKAQRMLLKLYAYIYQDDLLSKKPKWEVEHILPKSANDNNFVGFTLQEINETKEHLGNKLPLEKKTNIKASDNYLHKKIVEFYVKSKIKCVINFKNKYSDQISWTPNDIRVRDQIVVNEIITFLGLDINSFDQLSNLMPSMNISLTKSDFWKALNQKIILSKSNLLKVDESNQEALNRNYHNFYKKTENGIGDFYCRISNTPRSGTTSFGVYMYSSEADLFKKLLSQKEQINKELGFELTYKQKGQSFRIEYPINYCNINTPRNYDKFINEILDKMPKIYETLKKHK